MMLNIFSFKALVDISLLCMAVSDEGFSDFRSYFSARMPDSSNMCLPRYGRWTHIGHKK